MKIQIEISEIDFKGYCNGVIWANGIAAIISMPVASYQILQQQGVLLRSTEEDEFPDENGVLNESPEFFPLDDSSHQCLSWKGNNKLFEAGYTFYRAHWYEGVGKITCASKFGCWRLFEIGFATKKEMEKRLAEIIENDKKALAG